MNEFLADSLVLPPGGLDKSSLLPLADIQKMNKNVQQRRRMSRKDISPTTSPKKYNLKRRRMSVIPDDNLHRTGRLFGGLMNDIKRRLPWYWSDIKDGVNFQCLASIFFIFFANLAPAITFGGILGKNSSIFRLHRDSAHQTGDDGVASISEKFHSLNQSINQSINQSVNQ
jgi:hypothetical protein